MRRIPACVLAVAMVGCGGTAPPAPGMEVPEVGQEITLPDRIFALSLYDNPNSLRARQSAVDAPGGSSGTAPLRA